MRKLILAGAIGLLAMTQPWGACEFAGAAIPPCGGNQTEHVVPAQGLQCTNTAVLLDGKSWTIVLLVDPDGTGVVTFSTLPRTNPESVFVTPHIGLSGNDLRKPFSAMLVPGSTSVSVPFTMPGSCRGQIDIKAINNFKDTPTNQVRIAAPLVSAPNCSATTTTTSPTTSPPTTAEATSIPATTAPTTTHAPIPVTGRGIAAAGIGLLLLIVGLIVVLIYQTRIRPAKD